MKYKHVKTDQFYQDLPAGKVDETDPASTVLVIDDADLTAEQKALLAIAVAAGVYEPINSKKSKKDNPDEPEPKG